MNNMEKLSLVTFVSGNEALRDEFLALADNLQQFYIIDVVVFVDYLHVVNKNPLIRQIVSPGTTKYARILQLLLETPADYFGSSRFRGVTTICSVCYFLPMGVSKRLQSENRQ